MQKPPKDSDATDQVNAIQEKLQVLEIVRGLELEQFRSKWKRELDRNAGMETIPEAGEDEQREGGKDSMMMKTMETQTDPRESGEEPWTEAGGGGTSSPFGGLTSFSSELANVTESLIATAKGTAYQGEVEKNFDRLRRAHEKDTWVLKGENRRLEKEVRRIGHEKDAQQRLAKRLEREAAVFRRPQEPRYCGQRLGSLIYRFFAPLTIFECGGDSTSAAEEFKEFTSITRAAFSDPERKNTIQARFVNTVLGYACAALNARTNLTLRFGVQDDGHVVGIKVEDYSFVSVHIVLISIACGNF